VRTRLRRAFRRRAAAAGRPAPSRAANGVDDASAADALAAVWETRVLATFKQ